MSQAVELLKSIDAAKNSIAAAEAELNGYLTEKTNLQKEISDIEAVTLPSLRARLETATKTTLPEVTATYNANVAKYYDLAYSPSNTSSATYKLNQAQKAYNDAVALANLWYGRYHTGCYGSSGSAVGFQGTYCGEYGFLCKNSNVAPFDQDAPQGKCLDVDHRKARMQYAEQMATRTANDVQLAQKVLDQAKKDKAAAESTYNSVKNNTSAIESVKSTIQGIGSTISRYEGEAIPTKRQRISFVDGKITDIRKVITDLNRERDANEVNYQKLIAEEAEKQRITEELAKQEEFKRQQTELITKGSIDANLASLQPKTAEEIKSSSNKSLYALLGLGLIVVGIYVIKKK